MKIAVVADVHLHDLYGGYGWLKEGSGDIALRTLEDTMASTRVFNESYPAFRAVLDDIVQRGIRDVVLLGDYSDDGQPGAVAALNKILSSYETAHGLRFFITFGNHDCFGPAPQHQGKWLTRANGLDPVLVTSDENAASPAVAQDGMIGMSTADAREAMAAYGLYRPEGVFHWETPFGDKVGPDCFASDPLDPRSTDVSYLVESQEGLWLLILDANVFEQIEGRWQVRSDAAWDHVLTQRPYILDWITDVAERAERLGKTLLAFSHYPALPLTLVRHGDHYEQTGTQDWLKRMPSLKSGQSLGHAGIRWHFSGHMHVAGKVEFEGLVNIAVPSPVAYPGGYVEVFCGQGKMEYTFVRPHLVPCFDVAFNAYKQQALGCELEAKWSDTLAAKSYHHFLYLHLLALIEHRNIPNDWSAEIRKELETPLSKLFPSLQTAWEGCNGPILDDTTLRQMLLDYYVIRADEQEAIFFIPQQRLQLYRHLQNVISSSYQDRTSSTKFTFLLMNLMGLIPSSSR